MTGEPEERPEGVRVVEAADKTYLDIYYPQGRLAGRFARFVFGQVYEPRTKDTKSTAFTRGHVKFVAYDARREEVHSHPVKGGKRTWPRAETVLQLYGTPFGDPAPTVSIDATPIQSDHGVTEFFERLAASQARVEASQTRCEELLNKMWACSAPVDS